jgi:hypothetical protein
MTSRTFRQGAAGAFILGANLLQALAPAGLAAQAVRGRLLEMVSGTPIVLARISLLDSDDQPVVFTVTDTNGHFLLVAPEPGQYWIKAESTFHEDYSDGPIPLAGTDTVSLVFGLEPLPVELEGVVVEAERRSTRLALAGYYDRKEAGIGYYLDRDRIRSRPGRPVSEVIQLLPNVEMSFDTRFGDREPIFRRQQFSSFRGNSSLCYPQVFMNGGPLATGGPVPGGLGRITLNDLEGIEVYPSPAHLPGRFHGPYAHCGTIVLWTR